MSAQAKVRVKQKRCSCCGEMKGSGDYYRCSAALDGLQVYCKDCSYDAVREHNARKAKQNAMSIPRAKRLTPHAKAVAARSKWAAIAAEAAASA